MRSLLVLIILALCVDFTGYSQDVSVVNYTTEDGLPSSQVYDIIQDDYGYLWFSTDKGLSRYNGYEFQNFNKKHGLTDNVVFDLVKRPNGQIWATTNSSSLFYFEGANPKFSPYKFNHLLKKHASNKIVHSLYFSENKDVYLSFHDHNRYLRFSKTGEVLATPERISDYSLEGHEISICIVKDDNNDPFYYVKDHMRPFTERLPKTLETTSEPIRNTLLVRRFEALYFENSATAVCVFDDSIYVKDSKGEQKFSGGKEVIASGKLDESHFWLGYRYGGVRVYNLSGQIVNEFLEDKSVTQLFVDRDGQSWVSTLEEGVFMIRNTSMDFLSEVGQIRINSVAKGVSNDIFIGCYDGRIMNRASNGEVSLFFESDRYYQPVNIMNDPKRKQVYFSSGQIFDLNRTMYERVHVDYISLVDDRYLTNGTFGVRFYDLDSMKKGKLFGSIRTKDVISFKGALYAASIFGLYKSQIAADLDDYELVIDNVRIDDLEIFGDHLALGTNGNGLILIDELYKPQFHIEKKDGLTSNYVTKSYRENDSTLWIGTNKGINRITFDFENKDFKIEKMDAREGLASNEVWDIIVASDTVWIGTQRGVNFISKKDFSRIGDRLHSYFLQWKSMRVNDEPFYDVHSFDHDQNKIEFRVLGISFVAESDLVYQYKLLGLSDDWSYTKSRTITFSSLEPGNYELIVKVRSDYTTRGKNEIRYAFQIHPPFWKTWWFISICVILVVAVVYLFFKIRVLTYNKDVVREIMRYVLQKLRRDEPTIVIRENGKNVRIKTGDIHYLKTSGNYLELMLKGKSHLVRSSISKFMKSLPDEIEFIQVHRSYVVRIDKVQQKGKDELVVLDKVIPVGRVYNDQLKMIEL